MGNIPTKAIFVKPISRGLPKDCLEKLIQYRYIEKAAEISFTSLHPRTQLHL